MVLVARAGDKEEIVSTHVESDHRPTPDEVEFAFERLGNEFTFATIDESEV